MLLPKTNIQDVLDKERFKTGSGEQQVLSQVQNILNALDQEHDDIADKLTKSSAANTNNFEFDLLDTSKIYHINQIKNICIDFRLRFLDAKYFKGEIPSEGISKIKELEKEHRTSLQGFKIVAPSKLFKLEDKDDPLLFAPIGNGYYYLIHKWGNDLHPLRKILMWPFKNIVNLGLLVFAISYLVTLCIPEGLFSRGNSTSEFWIVYFFVFKGIAAVVLFYGFALGKNFNPAIWNSKYFNA